MKKLTTLSILFLIVICFDACVLDHINKYTSGRLIDHQTKLPLEGVIIKDSKSGYSATTDSSGRFNLIGIKPTQIIEIKKAGYKPFNLEITLKYEGEHEKFKVFKLTNERFWDKNGYKELNSNNYRIINGDSLIIELQKE